MSEKEIQPAVKYERGQFGDIIETLENYQLEGVREPVTIRIERDARNMFAVIDVPGVTRSGGGVNKSEALRSLARILRQEQKPAETVTAATEAANKNIIAIANTPEDPSHPTTPAEAA